MAIKLNRVKWEYRIESANLADETMTNAETLNKAGSDGWEAFAVLQETSKLYIFFRRPKTP